jgi:hypothetical protein
MIGGAVAQQLMILMSVLILGVTTALAYRTIRLLGPKTIAWSVARLLYLIVAKFLIDV